jgi:hypothetical protein
MLPNVVWLKLTDVSDVLLPPSSGKATSETSVNFYQTTRRNISGDSHPHTRRRENLKFHMVKNSHVKDDALDSRCLDVAQLLDKVRSGQDRLATYGTLTIYNCLIEGTKY